MRRGQIFVEPDRLVVYTHAVKPANNIALLDGYYPEDLPEPAPGHARPPGYADRRSRRKIVSECPDAWVMSCIPHLSRLGASEVPSYHSRAGRTRGVTWLHPCHPWPHRWPSPKTCPRKSARGPHTSTNAELAKDMKNHQQLYLAGDERAGCGQPGMSCRLIAVHSREAPDTGF